MNNKKLKVFHVIEALGGGVYSYFCDLTQVFGPSDRVQTTIIYNDQRAEIIPENVQKDFHSNVRLLKVPMNENISPFNDYKSIKALSRIFKKEQPDVIHLHSSKAGVLGKVAAKIASSQAQLFYTPHGYSFLRKDISSSKAAVFKAIEKRMASFYGFTTIACGDTEFDEAKKLHDRVELIRNGVPYNKIKTFLNTQPTSKFTVGILGRITHARNPKLFNEIALQLPDVQFVWIGDGILKDQITAPNITVTGWFMNRKEGLEHLNRLDVYLQTSLWEGLPIAVLEAMVFEKPVVATNVIGNRDIVLPSQTGFLIDDAAQAVQAITQLFDKDLRLQMGKNGSKRVDEVFNSTKNFSQLIDLYYSRS